MNWKSPDPPYHPLPEYEPGEHPCEASEPPEHSGGTHETRDHEWLCIAHLIRDAAQQLRAALSDDPGPARS